MLKIFRNHWVNQIGSALSFGLMTGFSTICFVDPLFADANSQRALYPEWWKDRDVSIPEHLLQNEAPVNLGQLKWVSTQLHRELDLLLPKGASFKLHHTYSNGSQEPGGYFDAPKVPTDSDYVQFLEDNQKPANLGQVKNIAKPFYDLLNGISQDWLRSQLSESGLDIAPTGSSPYRVTAQQAGASAAYSSGNAGNIYPWTIDSSDDANSSPIQLGQLKLLFALRTRSDNEANPDGLPDLFEHSLTQLSDSEYSQYVGGTGLTNPFKNKSLDEISITPGDTLVSYQQGTDLLRSQVKIPFLGLAAANASVADLVSQHESTNSISGSFEVSGDGSAAYAIPIEIPKGTANLEPQLAVVYSSNGGNSHFGLGFSLSGLQRITRGRTSYHKDGFVDGIDFDSNDRFFLDGERLVCVSGTYGQAGSKYRTETESYSRISLLHDTTLNQDYWRVETKAGLIMEFGRCSTSCVQRPSGYEPIVWAVNKVSDTLGNYYEVIYANGSGGAINYRPSKVRYTGFEGGHAPYNEVVFNWEDRDDQNTAYVYGSKIVNQHRVSSIDVKSAGSLLHSYEFSYVNSQQTGRSQLESVNMRSWNGGLLRNPLQFEWSNKNLDASQVGVSGMWQQDSSYTLPKLDQTDGKLGAVFADFTGNGNTDLVRFHRDASFKGYATSGGVVYSYTQGFVGEVDADFHLGTASGISLSPQSISDFSAASSSPWAEPELLDLDSDGVPELLAKSPIPIIWTTTQWSNLGYALGKWNGSQFVRQVIADPQSESPPRSRFHAPFPYNVRQFCAESGNGNTYQPPERIADGWVFSDFDGNGLIDLSVHSKSNAWCEYPGRTGKPAGSVGGGIMFTSNGINMEMGRRALLQQNDVGIWQLTRKFPNEAGPMLPIRAGSPTDTANNGRTVIDINGDGLPDAIASKETPGTEDPVNGVWLNNRAPGQANWTYLDTYFPSNEFIADDSGKYLGRDLIDINGDRLPDLIVAEETTTNMGHFRSKTYFNTGTGFEFVGEHDFTTGSAGAWRTGKTIDTLLTSEPWVIPTALARTGSSATNLENTRRGSLFADVNGDGLVDLLHSPNPISSNIGHESYCLINTGSGFKKDNRWKLPHLIHDNANQFEAGESQVRLQDLNNDGLIDLIHNPYADTPTVYLNRALKEQVIGITDGLGNKTTVNYKQLNDLSSDVHGRVLYTKGAIQSTETENQIVRIQDSRSVVANYTTPNGKGGVDRIWHYYGERKIDRKNGVDLGFKWTEVVSERAGSLQELSIKTYRQEFPFHGRVLDNLSVVLDDFGEYVLVGREQATYGQLPVPSGQLATGLVANQEGGVSFQRPYQITSLTEDFALNGTKTNFPFIGTAFEGSTLATNWTAWHGGKNLKFKNLSQTLIENLSFSDYGDPKVIRVTASDATGANPFVTTTTNEYWPATTTDTTTDRHWILGLVKKTTVSRSVPSNYQAVPDKVSSFTYYPSTHEFAGMAWTATIEPDETKAVTTTMTYDQFGNRKTVTMTAANGDQPERRITKTEYDSKGRFMVKEWDAQDRLTISEYDDSRALMLSSTDINGLITRFYYDQWGERILTRHPDGTESATISQWAKPATATDGQTITVQGVPDILLLRKSKTSGRPEAVAYLDILAREVLAESTLLETFDGSQSTHKKFYLRSDYDTEGRLWRRSAPFFAGETLRWTSQTFDSLDRPRVSTRPDTTTSELLYEQDSGYTTITKQSLDGGFQHATKVYSPQGMLLSSKDNAGKLVSYVYYADGKTYQTKAPDASGGQTHVSTMGYNIFNRQTSLSDPNAGFSSSTYYAFGEIETTTDGVGNTTTFTYDSLGRRETRSIKKADDSWESYTVWTYDTSAGKGIGKIHSVKHYDSQNGTLQSMRQHTYDRLGRRIRTEITFEGETKSSSVTYNDLGWVHTQTDAGGLTLENVYDELGFKSSLRDFYTGEIFWQAREYNSDGQVAQSFFGNGVTTTNTYDRQDGRLTRSVSQNAGVIQDFEFNWDDVGNLNWRKEHVVNRSEAFDYDGINQLIWSKVVSGLSPPTRGSAVQTVTYIPGTTNIGTKDGIGTYSYTGTDHLGNSVGTHAVTQVSNNGRVRKYAYNDNGSLTREWEGPSGSASPTLRRLVEWTAFGKVASVENRGVPDLVSLDPDTGQSTTIKSGGSNEIASSEFTYDGDLNRIKQVARHASGRTETTHYYGTYQEKFFSEYQNGQWTSTKIEKQHNIAGLAIKTTTLQGENQTTKLRFLLSDHLGSTSAVLDETGSVVERLSFDAWGARRNAKTWAASTQSNHSDVNRRDLITSNEMDIGFTGHEMLDEVGLVHMNGRIYDSELGRFLSPDPFVQAPDVVSSYNRYAYLFNNPLNGTDPTGYFGFGGFSWGGFWGGVSDFGSSLWGGISGFGSAIWGGISSFGSWAWGGIGSIGSASFGFVSDYIFSPITDYVIDPIVNLGQRFTNAIGLTNSPLSNSPTLQIDSISRDQSTSASGRDYQTAWFFGRKSSSNKKSSGGFWSKVGSLVKGAVKGAVTAVVAGAVVGAIAATGPIGLAVLGVAAVAGGIYAGKQLYDWYKSGDPVNWETVGEIVGGAGAGKIASLAGKAVYQGAKRVVGAVTTRFGARGASGAASATTNSAAGKVATQGEAPLAKTLEGHESGQGFSGVYDPKTKEVFLKPSASPTDFEAGLPDGFVPRRGGHLAVSREAGRDVSHFGFTGFLDDDGSLRLEWLSRSVNGPNPSFDGPIVPENMRPEIIDAVQIFTGRFTF